MTRKSTSGPRQGRWRPILPAALVLAGGAILAGCSATTVTEYMPTAAGGLPEGVPQRPAATPDYPAVHDRPQERAAATLTADEQKQLEDDLVAARNRLDNTGAAAKPAAGTTRNP